MLPPWLLVALLVVVAVGGGVVGAYVSRRVAVSRARTPDGRPLGALVPASPRPTLTIERNGALHWSGTDPHLAKQQWEAAKHLPHCALTFTQDGVTRDAFITR